MMTNQNLKNREPISSSKLRIGLVVPHIFMHSDILPRVIFSPGVLALNLANGLNKSGHDVTLFSPGPVNTVAKNITADLSYFEAELAGRNDTYIDLLKKHPLTFITLARQVQSELLAKAFAMANANELDVVHVYTNEEDTALPFSALCTKPVIFTHHDPFNFLIKYKNLFPKYAHLNWLSVSLSQRLTMPPTTNWVGNIYHGLEESLYKPSYQPSKKYLLHIGRIVSAKGTHIAIKAVKKYNKSRPESEKYVLKIAGKQYTGHGKEDYWHKQIEPLIDGKEIQYIGFVSDNIEKEKLISNAGALLVPSQFDEPFGMVIIEALACGTPVIGLSSGSIPELIKNNITGFIVPMPKILNEAKVIEDFTIAIASIPKINRKACRVDFEERFTLKRMVNEHSAIYKKLTK